MNFPYLYTDMTIKHVLIVAILSLSALSAHAFTQSHEPLVSDTVRFDDGSWYLGQISDSLFNGTGKMAYANGMIYEGEWSNGLWNGKGKLSYPDGDSYSGMFLNHEFHGLGTYTYANGAKYNGYWEHGMFNGAGTMEYADGSTYTGSWKDDMKDGLGVLYDAQTGVLLKGYFENDRFSHSISSPEQSTEQQAGTGAIQENPDSLNPYHCEGDMLVGFSFGIEQLFSFYTDFYLTNSLFVGISLGFDPTRHEKGENSIQYDSETGERITLVDWDWYPNEILTENTHNTFKLTAETGFSWKWFTLGASAGIGLKNTIRNCRSLEYNDSFFEPGTLYYRKKYDGVIFCYNVFSDIVVSRMINPFYACSMRVGYGNLEGFFMGIGFVF